MDILPFQNNSITRRWMEHKHTNQQAALLYLATGCLAAIAGYYKKNAFPFVGTGSLLAHTFLRKETPMSEDTPLKDLTLPTPIKMIHFVTFCSFLGLSLRQSWTKTPSAPIPTKWTSFLLKAPLYLAAYVSLAICCTIQGEKLGQTIVKNLDEGTNPKVLAVSILVLSVALIYFVPRACHFGPLLALGAILEIHKGLLAKQGSFENAFLISEKYLQNIWIIMMGSLIGLSLRYVIAPKNHTPTLPLKAKIPLSLLTALQYTVIFSLYILHQASASDIKKALRDPRVRKFLQGMADKITSLKKGLNLKKENVTCSELNPINTEFQKAFEKMNFKDCIPLAAIKFSAEAGVSPKRTLNEMQSFLNQILDSGEED